MDNRSNLIRDNIKLLEQGLDLLSGLDPELYAAPEPSLSSSGVGSHVRHILDHYSSLLTLLDGPGSKVDYDRRERDTATEVDPDVACKRIMALIESLLRLEGCGQDRLQVKLDTGKESWALSSMGRELQFVASHTIHHYALIGVLLRLRGIQPPSEFGVAPSTLRYWEANGVALG